MTDQYDQAVMILARRRLAQQSPHTVQNPVAWLKAVEKSISEAHEPLRNVRQFASAEQLADWLEPPGGMSPLEQTARAQALIIERNEARRDHARQD